VPLLCLLSVQLRILGLDSNGLAGPALPPAWLEPGTMQRLEELDLMQNLRLNGTLPATLPWPVLRKL